MMKKNKQLAWLGLTLALCACGQPGPLYLPADAPPVYVPPEEQVKQEPEASPQNLPAEKTLPQPDNNQQKQPQ